MLDEFIEPTLLITEAENKSLLRSKASLSNIHEIGESSFTFERRHEPSIGENQSFEKVVRIESSRESETLFPLQSKIYNAPKIEKSKGHTGDSFADVSIISEVSNRVSVLSDFSVMPFKSVNKDHMVQTLKGESDL